MKNKSGFTLVEMIAVLVLLVALFLVAFPPVLKVLNDTTIKLSESETVIIKDATLDYLNNNNTYEQKTGDSYCINVETLLNDAYLDEKSIPNTAHNSIVNVNINDEILMDISNTCIKESKKVKFELLGDKIIELERGNTLTDPGVKATDKAGNDVTDQVEIKYYDFEMFELSSILTTYPGIYTIEYILIIDDIKYVIERNVKIIVGENPIITHSGDLVISKSEKTYNILEGVSAVDYEGNSLEIIVKTNLALGIPGNYYIEYTAIDKNKNKTIILRNIEVEE